jgi:hypothetical protein
MRRREAGLRHPPAQQVERRGGPMRVDLHQRDTGAWLDQHHLDQRLAKEGVGDQPPAIAQILDRRRGPARQHLGRSPIAFRLARDGRLALHQALGLHLVVFLKLPPAAERDLHDFANTTLSSII